MSLKTEGGAACHIDPLQRAIKQRPVSCDNIVRQGRLVYGETMVLARNHDSAAVEILYRVIGAMMTKFHFLSLCTHRQCEQLVAQADSENRNSSVQK